MRSRARVTRLTALGVLLTAAVALLAGFTTSSTRSVADVDPNATMIVAIDTDPTQIDPRLNHSVVLVPPVQHMYEALIMKNWYEGPDVVKVVPVLAESYTISKDGTTYTFKIRKGITFHDGARMDAYAVQFNYRVLFDKSFKYFNELANAFIGLRLPNIVGYKALDRWTFRLTLSQRDGTFIDRVAALNELSIVSPAAIQKYGNQGIATHPSGTGPFVFRSYTPGQTLVLDRNDKYWRGPSKVKTLVFRVIPDVAARTAALEAHEVHSAENISIKNLPRYEGRRDYRIVIRQAPSITGCLLNFRQGPTMKKAFRQALNVAINRDAINKIVFLGKAAPVSGYFGPGSGEYFDGTLPQYKYDPALARKLLQQSGTQGASLHFLQSLGNQNSVDVITIVQEQLRAVGINLKVDMLDQATWLRQLTKGIDGSGIDGICAQGYGNETSAQGFDLFTKRGWPPAGFNAGFYTSKATEAALAAANASTTHEQYTQALRAVDRVVNQDYAMFSFVSSPKIVGIAGNVIWTPAQSRMHLYYSAKLTKK